MPLKHKKEFIDKLNSRIEVFELHSHDYFCSMRKDIYEAYLMFSCYEERLCYFKTENMAEVETIIKLFTGRYCQYFVEEYRKFVIDMKTNSQWKILDKPNEHGELYGSKT